MSNSQEEHLVKYIKAFKKLKRDHKNGGAPHKPILLLGLILSYEKKEFLDNKVYVTPELLSYFKTYWSQLVITQHDPRFALPFYHMRSEPFWRLHPNPGCEKWIDSKGSMRSFNNLISAVAYAEIDYNLFALFKDENSRDILKATLLDTYFPESGVKDISILSEEHLNALKTQILKENREEYMKKIEYVKRTLSQEEYEEEVFTRSNVFKREVPKIYNFTCCISELKVDILANVAMVDACHILPFSESYDDTISNGFTLCPNLHRAFDRGIISIDNHYRVIISKQFRENHKSPYSIKQFAGKKILLPADNEMLPSLQNFSAHRIRFGFNS